MRRYQLFINGEWRDPASDLWFESKDPFTGGAWAEIPRGDRRDVEAAVAAAHAAFENPAWRGLSASQRGALVRKLGATLLANAGFLAEVESQDNGKLIAEVRSQLGGLAGWYDYFGGLADKIEGSLPSIEKPNILAYTKYEPLGVCALITPWNSPLALLTWKLAPALAAGNTVVIKPSEFTSASTLEFARLSQEVGFPAGVINVVTGDGVEVGDPLVRHRKVRKVAFTGGESAGRTVNRIASEDFKKVTLELGGKSANIVFDDADLDKAVDGVLAGIFSASGQTCVAGSRLLVHATIHDAFVDRLVTAAGTARFGDPRSADTKIGPIATEPQFRKILDYIDIARGEGARCVLGGGPFQMEGSAGLFVQPTIFTGVTSGMRIAQEEVFGPVLAVIPFSTKEEAVAIANDVNYGLAAGVWTENLGRALYMIDRLAAGTVWVNTYRSSSYTMPFGGYKLSGLGRENGMTAVLEYLQIKSVWLQGGPA